MQLTFRDGSFYLNNKAIPVRAAVRHQAVADKIARKVFDRILVKHFSPPKSTPEFLDPHQKEGLKFILSRSRSYLAHAPGAGKTAQAIIAALYNDVGLIGHASQAVFIVPPTLTKNWEREILKWARPIWPSIYVVGQSKDQDNADFGADFIIVPDSMLTKPWVYAQLSKLKPKVLAVDEASRFKEATSERTRALFGGQANDGQRMFYGLVQNAKHSVLLDGSPMPNRPLELWAPLTGMAPQSIDFMSLHDFGVRYCAGRFVADKHVLDWDYSGASNQDELKARLKKFMHVVPESALGHPERLRSLLFMEPNGVAKIKDWEQRNVPTYIGNIDERLSVGDIAKHRQKIGLAKVPWVIEYVRGRLETKNESILLFAWHRAVCGELESGLRTLGARMVTGGTKPSEREDIFRSFQSGHCRVIVGNIAAMGRGLNLQRAKRIIFAEYSWTDELNKQCEKRASRKGATADLVRCDYIVAAGTMDETVLTAVFTKARNVERIVG